MPHATVVDPEQEKIEVLNQALKQAIVKELQKTQAVYKSICSGSPGETYAYAHIYHFFEPPNFIIPFRFLAPGRKSVFPLSTVENR